MGNEARLTGTEKQIAWAEKIRPAKILEAEATLASARQSAERAIAAGKPPAEIEATIAKFERALDRLAAVRAAAWWIDKRRESGKSLLADLADPEYRITF